jgi:hypothetical protein
MALEKAWRKAALRGDMRVVLTGSVKVGLRGYLKVTL